MLCRFLQFLKFDEDFPRRNNEVKDFIDDNPYFTRAQYEHWAVGEEEKLRMEHALRMRKDRKHVYYIRTRYQPGQAHKKPRKAQSLRQAAKIGPKVSGNGKPMAIPQKARNGA